MSRIACSSDVPVTGTFVALHLAFALLLAGAAVASQHGEAASGTLHDPRETRLADVQQLTAGGENAEAYWSPDGTSLVFQRTLPGVESCDHIYRLDLDDAKRPTGPPTRVSTGTGRTTCAYYLQPESTDATPRVIFASTHADDPDCPPVPDRSQGYVWPIYPSYDLYTANPDGSDLRRLTDAPGYDAEATVCPVDGSILFTSMRDGDLDLYRMNADGSEVTRLTDEPGYDGGAFFSADCSRIVWRASRPTGDALTDYQRLLGQGLVRPGKLEIWIADADGNNARQVTYLDAASFAPYFFPDGQRILFSSNVGDPGGREFDLWAVDIDGSNLERVTFTPGFDGFPMFSPDGSWLAFGSNRNQGKPGETDVYIARWRDDAEPHAESRPTVAAPAAVAAEADAIARTLGDVRWLADDAREGRGVGTEGLAAAERFVAARLDQLGFAPLVASLGGTPPGGTPPGGDPPGGDPLAAYLHPVEVPVAVTVGPATALVVGGARVDDDALQPAAFSASTRVQGPIVAVGYGIHAPELGHDDYADRDVEGAIVAVRRYVPDLGTAEAPGAFADPDARRRYGDLRHKAFTARERGAVGILFVDLPEVANDGAAMPDDAPPPTLRSTGSGDAGLPAAFVRRAVGARFFDGGG
ncbi:MAG: PA domain-containing protein, partial [Acidobacteriota bacterium]